jgi:hypothetical protein
MTRRTSQNTRTREPCAAGERRHPTLLSLITGTAFLAALFMAVIWYPASELGRTVDAHLTQLADPGSWIR